MNALLGMFGLTLSFYSLFKVNCLLCFLFFARFLPFVSLVWLMRPFSSSSPLLMVWKVYSLSESVTLLL